MPVNTAPEYMQLDPGDDVPSVRDRLSFIRGRKVLLIWPEDGTALTRKLDLVLLQREAKRRVIQLALVTHDEEVITHARELGISSFETVTQAERSRWKRGRNRVFMPRHHRPDDNPEPDDLMPVASRVRNKRKISRVRYWLTRVLVLGVLFGTLGSVAYLSVPSADVYLTPASETVTTETVIIADASVNDVDIENGIIPATILRANVQTVGTVSATGRRNSETAPAIGMITITNRSDQAVEIPEDTRVSTSSGEPVEFRTTRAASLPAREGAGVNVPIQAIAASDERAGNIGAGQINRVSGDLSEQIDVRNLSPTTGGSSQQQAIVTADDHDHLRGIVRGQLQTTAYTEMESRLSETQLIVIETLRISEERSDWTRFSHAVGAVSDTVSLDMRVVVTALAIDDRFARQVVFGRLSSQKPPNLILSTDSFLYSRGPVSDSSDDTVTFSASGEGLATARINAMQLQERLAGASLNDAARIIRQTVNLAEGSTPRVTVSPQWLNHLPLLPIRINVHTEPQP